jgi:hypothetical protein
MLSFNVLLGDVWAREANVYAVHGREGVEFGIVKLTTVVTLYGCKRKIKLCMSKCMKRGEHCIGIGFLVKRNGP